MIQANELRIENTVMYNGRIYDIRSGEDLDWMPFEPIPLTEEWLLRFSFKWEGYHPDTAQREYYEDKSGFSICKKDNRFYYDKTKIETVHHLQNLYYFITGSELVLSTVPASNPS